MIPETYKDTVLGAACVSLGYNVTNPAFYRDIVPPEVTDEMLIAECERLLAEVNPPPNALNLAETHVASFFTTARLLQMKVWWDTFPVEDVPKLAAVFNWTGGITIQAAQGNTNFTAPPHTFEELLAEAMEILGVQ